RATNIFLEWLRHNEELAAAAQRTGLSAIWNSRRNMLAAIIFALAVATVFGFVTYRRIVIPIQGLQTRVESIASGEYVQPVPFTQLTDEIGALARSVSVLKQGAATMAEQRWIKANIAKLAGVLQSATSLPEFGEHLLSGLVPVLGGGVAVFYANENGGSHLRRISGYGLADNPHIGETLSAGEGLPRQCAKDRVSIVVPNLPPDYLRISSGVGSAT